MTHMDRRADSRLPYLSQEKVHAWTISLSPDGETMALWCSDHRIRVIDVSSGRLRRVYNESLEAASELHKTGGEMFEMEDMDFGHR